MTNLSSEEQRDMELYNTPEKWYVRQRWVEFAQQRKAINNRLYLRYLTLTCIPVYDIRLLKDRGLIRITDSGYDESLAICEINKLRFSLIGNKLPGARIFPGRIQDLVGTRSVNYHKYVNRWFPFDVINLDITGSPFQRNQMLSKTIQKLFNIQQWKEQSFTLFLTVCSTEEGGDKSARKDLTSLLESNLSNNEFKDAFLGKYPDMQVEPFYEFLSIAIPKMVIENGLNNGFDVVCKGKYTYIGTGLANRMISFVFDNESKREPGAVTSLGRIRSSRVIEVLKADCTDVNRSFSQDSILRENCRQLAEEYLKSSEFGDLQ